MSLHADLLEQARHLARRERRRPRQASLRRAISAAYYALFHLLVHDAARLLSRASRLPGIQSLISRAFDHSEMVKASRSFSGGNLPNHVLLAVGAIAIPQPLRDVSESFVALQQVRHRADYDLAIRFTRLETTDHVEQAEDAFRDWNAVRNDPVAKLYLVALFAWDDFRA